jgi:hypothetical protein
MMDKVSNVQQLAIFKIDKAHSTDVEDTMLFCGYADSQEEALSYMEQVQKEIDYNLQEDLQGEYIVIPALYFNLKKSVDRKTKEESLKNKSDENGSTKRFKEAR